MGDHFSFICQQVQSFTDSGRLPFLNYLIYWKLVYFLSSNIFLYNNAIISKALLVGIPLSPSL